MHTRRPKLARQRNKRSRQFFFLFDPQLNFSTDFFLYPFRDVDVCAEGGGRSKPARRAELSERCRANKKQQMNAHADADPETPLRQKSRIKNSKKHNVADGDEPKIDNK